MAVTQTSVDPRIYGGDPVTSAQPPVVPATPASEPYSAPAPVEFANLAPASEAAAAAAQAEASRPTSSLWGSVQAAWGQTATMQLWQYAQGPSFPVEAGYNPAFSIGQVRMPLTLEQERWLLQARSPEEFAFRESQLRTQAEAARAIGDNPIASAVVSVLDPVYLGLDLASVGLGRAIALGRAGTAVLAGAGAAGISSAEAQMRPVSSAELIANILLNGAASGLVYSPATRRLEKADPSWPQAELEAAARAIQPSAPPPAVAGWAQKLDDAGNPVLDARGKPVYVRTADAATGRADARTARRERVLGETGEFAYEAPVRPRSTVRGKLTGQSYTSLTSAAVFKHVAQYGDAVAAPLARALEERVGPMLDNLQVYVLSDADLKAQSPGQRAYYSVSEHAVYVGHSTSPQSMLHEIAHAATVDKITHGLARPDTETGRLVAELDNLRRSALAEAERRGSADDMIRYLTKDTREFVAGLYTGDTSFLRLLADMPDPGGQSKNLLSRLVDTVRKVLGFTPDEANALVRALKITDDLLDSGTFRGGMGRSYAPPDAAGVVQRVDSLAKRTGDTIAWNLHKTLAKWNRSVADLLVDDPVNMAGDSVISQREVIRRGLTQLQYGYMDLLREAMAARGVGTRKMVFNPTEALLTQRNIEREVAAEMLRREQAQRLGLTVQPDIDPQIKGMADALQKVADAALTEMQRAGVNGADTLNFRDGFFSRRWDAAKIEDVLQRLQTGGFTAEQAKGKLVQFVAGAARRANGWDHQLAEDVGRALIDRALRKGQFNDASFRAHVGNETIAEVRSILTDSGIRGDRLQRALDVLAGQVDEAGKISTLKHRIDLDTSARMLMPMPDGSHIGVLDLIDTNLTSITDRYIDTVAGSAALARKGLGTPTQIGALRQQLLEGIPAGPDREAASRMFDDVLNYVQGRPVGEAMSDGLRKLSAVTQMVGLGSSGLWQLTEYATAAGHYGLLKTARYALANMPGFKQMFNDLNPTEAGHLKNVLHEQSSQDLRLRPFISRLEDNFEFNLDNATMLSLQQAKQLVPYFNAMRWIHAHQARTVANLIVDTFRRGVDGDARAIEALERYGLERTVLGTIAKDVQQHGLRVDQWADASWDAVRGPLTKMMDESVLRNRVGEIPAFAQFSAVGKFIFTFRTFVLGAHNKILSGTLGRQGFAGASLIALYQFPLAMLAVSANNTLRQRESQGLRETAMQAVSQMGVLGLFSDAAGALFGTKQQFGAPGLLAIDRGFSLLSNVGSGQFGSAASDVLNAIPILPIIPGIKAIGQELKTLDE